MDHFFPEPFFLAPMAEITTPALRRSVKKFSHHVVLYSEMLSAAAVVYGGVYDHHLAGKHDFDDPFIYQILGDSPELMARACGVLSEHRPFAIDINMGCSAPDILKRGWGATLLRDRESTRSIIRACREATACRLSVKMRSGFQDHSPSMLLDMTKMFQDEGIDFITLHPRFARLSFRRRADWKLIELVKSHVSIPVIGNGDIIDPVSAVEKLATDVCDGIMIGREAVKSPWIFRLCNSLLRDETETLTISVRDTFIEILGNIRDMLPQDFHKSRAHRFCFYYTRNVVFGHDLFSKIRVLRNIDDMIGVVADYFSRNPRESTRTFYIHEGTLSMEYPGHEMTS